MNARARARVFDWIVPLGFGAALWLLAPLRTALEFGPDEGFELMKGFLVSRGHPLYAEVWNDQPPLHTEILALLFRLFGPSAYVGRLLAVVFAMGLVGSLYAVVRRQHGRVAGLLAILLLASSSSFLQLSVSVMLELPAVALGTAALWASSRYANGDGKRWLVFAGVLFGSALQVKLTAAIFLPALLANWLVFEGGKPEQPNPVEPIFRPRRLEVLVGIGSALAAFGVILVAFYRLDTLSAFWGSHFSDGTQRAASQKGYAFRPQTLLNDLALVIPAAVGLILAAYQRRRELLAPVVLLVTALFVHLWHRPYWYYYFLHFSVPMAWLGAAGLTEMFRALWRMEFSASRWVKLRLGTGLLAWCAVLSLVLSSAPERLWWEITRLQAAAPASESGTVQLLSQHTAQARWIFSDRRVEAFWAKLPIPPELAVIPSKRIWSGQISSREVLGLLERYDPELILVSSEWETKFQLAEYLRTHYRTEPSDGRGNLHLRN